MIVGVSDEKLPASFAPHPGGFIQSGYLDAEGDYPGMSVSAAAAKLGVSRVHLSRVIHGHKPVTVELAMKLEAAGWATAESWLDLQTRHDIAQARERLNQPLAAAPAVRRVKALEAETASASVAA